MWLEWISCFEWMSRENSNVASTFYPGFTLLFAFSRVFPSYRPELSLYFFIIISIAELCNVLIFQSNAEDVNDTLFPSCAKLNLEDIVLFHFRQAATHFEMYKTFYSPSRLTTRALPLKALTHTKKCGELLRYFRRLQIRRYEKQTWSFGLFFPDFSSFLN